MNAEYHEILRQRDLLMKEVKRLGWNLSCAKLEQSLKRKHRTPTCKCGLVAVNYSEKYDAYYCPLCGEWIDNKCADPECAYCKDRPDKPPVEWHDHGE